LGIYLLRRSRRRQKKEDVPNFEIIRNTLVRQLDALGVHKPAFSMFSARFALEGIRDGNPRKIQASGLRELQFSILETIRNRGAELKIRTAAYLFISYIDRVINALRGEQSHLEKEVVALVELRKTWKERLREIDGIVDTCNNRIQYFFNDRIPNAESFAEREALTATPEARISRAFATVVVKQSEIRSLARQLSEHIDATLASHVRWFNISTGKKIIAPMLQPKIEGRAIERLRALALGQVMTDDDGVPTVVNGLLEVQQLMHDAFRQSTGENLQRVNADIQKYCDETSSALESRKNRIKRALDEFQSRRNDFNANQ
jgi:hypothetical protein